MGIARGWEKRIIQTKITYATPVRIFSASPQSRSLFSALFQAFCLTVRANVKTQKYGLFCSQAFCLTARAYLNTQKFLGFLRRNLRINSPNLKSLAYKTLIRPLLEYSSAAWDPCTKENVKKLEMVQRRAAQYVLNRFNYLSSVDEMLQELQWNTLEERRKKDRLVMFYKIHND